MFPNARTRLLVGPDSRGVLRLRVYDACGNATLGENNGLDEAPDNKRFQSLVQKFFFAGENVYPDRVRRAHEPPVLLVIFDAVNLDVTDGMVRVERHIRLHGLFTRYVRAVLLRDFFQSIEILVPPGDVRGVKPGVYLRQVSVRQTPKGDGFGALRLRRSRTPQRLFATSLSRRF